MTTTSERATFEEACALAKSIACRVNFHFFGVDTTMRFLAERLQTIGWTHRQLCDEARRRIEDRPEMVAYRARLN